MQCEDRERLVLVVKELEETIQKVWGLRLDHMALQRGPFQRPGLGPTPALTFSACWSVMQLNADRLAEVEALEDTIRQRQRMIDALENEKADLEKMAKRDREKALVAERQVIDLEASHFCSDWPVCPSGISSVAVASPGIARSLSSPPPGLRPATQTS